MTASAQQIITAVGNRDSAAGYYNGTSELIVHNNLKSASTTPVYIRWNVIESQFGTGWEMIGSGFCDNQLCQTASMGSNFFTSGASFKSLAYDNGDINASTHDFHMVFVSSNPPLGSSAWVRINAKDTVSKTSRVMTFIAYKAAAGVPVAINSSDDVVLYPVPAREAVNVIYNGNAGVKTIAIYNLIGKLMGPIYRPTDNNSAKINLEDMPNGMYFLRLMDGQGQVIATRRFTRQ